MRTLALPLLVSAACLSAAPASADPRCDLPVSAFVTDAAGTALDGSLDVEVRVYLDDAPDALPVECRTLDGAPVDSGWLRLTLDACAEPSPTDCGGLPIVDIVRAAADGLWVGLVVGESGTELAPRIPVGAVPYALSASDADTLEGLAASAFEEAGALGAHTADPDAHHPADSSGIDLRPASVTVGDTVVEPDRVDFGPDANDELTAEIVRTLSDGGDADALHGHASGSASGGLCYTAWGESACAVDFTLIYSGLAAQQSLYDTSRSIGAAGGPICVSSASVSSTSRLAQWDYSQLGILGSTVDQIITPDDHLACALCCR